MVHDHRKRMVRCCSTNCTRDLSSQLHSPEPFRNVRFRFKIYQNESLALMSAEMQGRNNFASEWLRVRSSVGNNIFMLDFYPTTFQRNSNCKSAHINQISDVNCSIASVHQFTASSIRKNTIWFVVVVAFCMVSLKSYSIATGLLSVSRVHLIWKHQNAHTHNGE